MSGSPGGRLLFTGTLFTFFADLASVLAPQHASATAVDGDRLIVAPQPWRTAARPRRHIPCQPERCRRLCLTCASVNRHDPTSAHEASRQDSRAETGSEGSR
ncbi:hypothetical protein PsYK624_059420 [Phanerochaete sordida]|uniref:Secreted protein n=1 Tax=Phanerochaete sordida TaxID=48140 RepID=A0A9P3LD07_9APHY|nr:hypothetical protein PsYK624_059420 [Phanerochaete sordida]